MLLSLFMVVLQTGEEAKDKQTLLYQRFGAMHKSIIYKNEQSFPRFSHIGQKCGKISRR